MPIVAFGIILTLLLTMIRQLYLKRYYKYHDLTQKPPISQCFKVTFVEQPKASYLEECEDKWFHKIDVEINI